MEDDLCSACAEIMCWRRDSTEKSDLREILARLFKRIDKVNMAVKGLDKVIREKIGPFENEDECGDPEIKEQVGLKNVYLDQARFLYEMAGDTADRLSRRKKPVAARCAHFTESFGSAQDALDHINSVLGQSTWLEGTRELFTGLGHGNSVASYSPVNLYYLEYKLRELFHVEAELVYEDARIEEYLGFIEAFIYDGLKKNAGEMLEAAGEGVMCSFDYLNVLWEAYRYLRDNFTERSDIKDMLRKIGELNMDLFRDSPLVVYGCDEGPVEGAAFMDHKAQDGVPGRRPGGKRIQAELRNPDVNEKYVPVYRHRGVDICTLKIACPADGGQLGYLIDHVRFRGREYKLIQDAINDIVESRHARQRAPK